MITLSHKKYLMTLFLLFLLLIVAPAASSAQESLTDLAKEEQNPLSTMTQLGLKYFSYSGAGVNGKQDPKLLNLFISMPYKWNKDWDLITQTNVSFASWKYGPQNLSGAGNLQMQMYFSPRNSSFIWGVGPMFQFPTASNPLLDNGQFAAGPTFAAVRKQGRWVNAIQGYHLWKLGGSNDHPAMNYSMVQLAVNYNLKNGWAVSLGSGIIIDWTIKPGEKTTVPLSFSIGRTITPRRRGAQPLSWNVGAAYTAIRPTAAPKWQYKFQITFLFPQRTIDSPKQADKMTPSR